MSRDSLIAAEITLEPESRDYSLVLKNHVQKFNLYFQVEILKIASFLEKSLNKTISGKKKMRRRYRRGEKKEDDDRAHYSLEEQKEREAQKEKERAEAMREEKRAKGGSSEKRSGQPKAKGGSPRGADDL